MRRSLVAGNWKMNGLKSAVDQLLEAILLGSGRVSDIDLALFPPYVYLEQVSRLLSGSEIAWGTQNVSSEPDGAFTGEISVSMLQDFQCHYVIVGHSERRTLYGESNEVVAAKFSAAMRAGIIPILCVGESLEQRESEKTMQVVQEQLAAVLSLKDNLPDLRDMVIAYEPIWAIGTGKTATPEQAQEVHEYIRMQLHEHDKMWAKSIRILYGGSVKPDNAAALFAMQDIDGALVGGASLKAEQFLEIGEQCNNLS